MTYKEICLQGISQLEQAGVGEASLDARLLLEEVCHTDRNTLLVHGDREVSGAEETLYRKYLTKRAAHIPLQQIIGRQDFMGLSFEVDAHVLIPRQDTEILVEEAMRYIHDGMNILDMCTGSGCILISLLHYSNDCTGMGVDLSQEALTVASKNAKNLIPAENVTFVRSDLFSKVCDKFDVIVSNPPYIRPDVIEGLMPEVKDHEPRMALDGGADGLDFYRKIVEHAPNYLVGGGRLLFEIGYDQGSAVKALMERNGFVDVNIIKDYAGLDRVVSGQNRIL